MSKAASTRQHILRTAFELIYERGYKNTSIDEILEKTEVTKGAFYYHFRSKDEMGLAIINELMKPVITEGFVGLLRNSTDPLRDIYATIEYLLMKDPFLKPQYGCPAGNFVHEASGWSRAFNNALHELIDRWDIAIRNAINSGKRAGTIRRDVNAAQVSLFIISGYWGIRSYGKLNNGRKAYTVYLKEMKKYLRDQSLTK